MTSHNKKSERKESYTSECGCHCLRASVNAKVKVRAVLMFTRVPGSP